MKNQRVKNGPPTRDVNAAVRVEQAIKLRCRKVGYVAIATACGYASAGAAHNAIQRELNRRISRAVDELRNEEAALYDDLQHAVYPLAVPDDEPSTDDDTEPSVDDKPQKPSKPKKPSLFAVDRVLAISAARRQLLGLDVKPDASASSNQLMLVSVAADVLAAI